MGSLLMDICEYFLKTGKDKVFSETLVMWLGLSEGRSWLSMKGSGKVTAKWLAMQMRAYGVGPKIMRIEGERANGYELENFKAVFQRYIPKAELDAFQERLKEAKQLEQAEQAKTSSKTGEQPPAPPA